MPRLRLALAQGNPIVGDFAGNADRIVEAACAVWDACAAIGPKISGMAFGRDRRLPITSRSAG